MKIALSFFVIFLFAINSCAQSQTISKGEYEKAFKFAVSETNADYPLIFKVVTSIFENGKTVRINTEINENEAAGRYRIKRSVLADGRETNQYQLTVGFGNVFCSDDGKIWKPSKYECPAERMVFIVPNPESVEYSVSKEVINGKQVKIFHKYSVFASAEAGRPKTFNKKIATMDSRGYFISVVDTEGNIDPKTVTLIRQQSWETQAKIEPVVSPK